MLSLCAVVHECCAAVLSLLSGLYHVHGLRVSSLCPVACWHYLPALSFQKVLLFFLSFTLLFHHVFFLFYLWFIGHFVPTCYLAWLGQPFCISLVICICLHPEALSLVVLISVLLYQSAAFVFLDGSRVSLELVMESLAFHLFVVGTVIFALCSYDCSRPLLCCRQ